MTTKKYICICDYGQVRSVAMAWFTHRASSWLGKRRFKIKKKKTKKRKGEQMKTDSYLTDDWILRMFEGWFDLTAANATSSGIAPAG